MISTSGLGLDIEDNWRDSGSLAVYEDGMAAGYDVVAGICGNKSPTYEVLIYVETTSRRR